MKQIADEHYIDAPKIVVCARQAIKLIDPAMDLIEVSVSDHGHFVYYEIANVLKNGREHFFSLSTT